MNCITYYTKYENGHYVNKEEDMPTFCSICSKPFVGGALSESTIKVEMKVPLGINCHLRCWKEAGGNIPEKLISTINKLEEEANAFCKSKEG